MSETIADAFKRLLDEACDNALRVGHRDYLRMVEEWHSGTFTWTSHMEGDIEE